MFIDKFIELITPSETLSIQSEREATDSNLCQIFEWFSNMNAAELKDELSRVRKDEFGALLAFSPDDEYTVVTFAALALPASILFLCLRFGGDPNVIFHNRKFFKRVGTCLDLFKIGETCKERNDQDKSKQVMLRAYNAKTFFELQAQSVSEVVVSRKLPYAFGRVIGEQVIPTKDQSFNSVLDEFEGNE